MYSASEVNLFTCKISDPNHYLKYLNGRFDTINDINLGGNKFYKNLPIDEIDFTVRFLKKQWLFIQNIVLLDNIAPYTEITQARHYINTGSKYILQNNSKEKKAHILKAINSLAISVLPLESFDDKILLKLCYSKQSTNCPIYEYFHCYLDVQLYILIFRIKCDSSKNSIENHIEKIITDIIIISRKYFMKESNIEQPSFICDCIKHFWIILHSITQEYFDCDMFWNKFTSNLKNDDDLFSLWMLKDMAYLNTTLKLKPNYDFIKEKLKMAMTESKDLLKHLKLIHPFICELWLNDNRVEILLLLWEYFSKRLNVSSKYKNGHNVTCLEFTESLDLIIFNTKDCDEEFEFFVGMLVNYLGQQPNHWGKIKCRLFSQLSPFKIAELGGVGVHRVLQLLIGLTQVNQEELDKRIVSVFGNLKEDMITMSVINIYVSFIIRHVRESKNIAKIAPSLVKILQNASENQDNFKLIKEFFNGFQHIIKLSNNMQLHQWSIIDSWIVKYLATCYLPDLEAAVQILLQTVRKIDEEDAWSNWNEVLKKHVYPVLKQIGNNSSCPPLIGELAGEICILSSDLLNESFSFFNSETVNFKVTEKYLCTVLKNHPTSFSLTQNQEELAVQSWIRILLYSSQNCDEITKNILKLDTIPTCVKEKMGNRSDPFVDFIETVSSNKNLFLSSLDLSRFCEMCFENLDKSLEIHLKYVKTDTESLRIYTCLALAFMQCGNLLYNRHGATRPMVKLLTCLLFPTEFMMGKIPHPFFNTVQKTWHIFFEGLLKLNSDNDPYIQRSLRDLISKFIPDFSVGDSPIYKCLQREHSANVILEKISSIYLKHPTKEMEFNVTKSLKILNEYVKSTTSSNLLKIVVVQTFFGLCEVYIFQSQKNLALSIIMNLSTCRFYDQLKDEIIKSLSLITEKHLAFNTKPYFNLINILAKTIPNEISILRESIVEKIKNVEGMRGIGHDENLRSHLSTLNSVLHC